mmetsp:Transcript_18027/g.63744  ORF Transcript_18027/g.63744 Transcript_18027/m.63744 type:complete len:280 (-) Transcript_18027:209-1048(-)
MSMPINSPHVSSPSTLRSALSLTSMCVSPGKFAMPLRSVSALLARQRYSSDGRSRACVSVSMSLSAAWNQRSDRSAHSPRSVTRRFASTCAASRLRHTCRPTMERRLLLLRTSVCSVGKSPRPPRCSTSLFVRSMCASVRAFGCANAHDECAPFTSLYDGPLASGKGTAMRLRLPPPTPPPPPSAPPCIGLLAIAAAPPPPTVGCVVGDVTPLTTPLRFAPQSGHHVHCAISAHVVPQQATTHATTSTTIPATPSGAASAVANTTNSVGYAGAVDRSAA